MTVGLIPDGHVFFAAVALGEEGGTGTDDNSKREHDETDDEKDGMKMQQQMNPTNLILKLSAIVSSSLVSALAFGSNPIPTTTTTTTTTTTRPTTFTNPFVIHTAASSPLLFATTSTMPEQNGRLLSIVTPENVSLEIKDPVDKIALGQAQAIIDELRPDGAKVDPVKLVEIAKRLGDIKKDEEDATFIVSKEACKAAFEGLTDKERTALVNMHGRVKTFADAQRKSIADVEIDVPGGKAGHTVSPCKGTSMHSPQTFIALSRTE